MVVVDGVAHHCQRHQSFHYYRHLKPTKCIGRLNRVDKCPDHWTHYQGSNTLNRLNKPKGLFCLSIGSVKRIYQPDREDVPLPDGPAAMEQQRKEANELYVEMRGPKCQRSGGFI